MRLVGKRNEGEVRAPARLSLPLATALLLLGAACTSQSDHSSVSGSSSKIPNVLSASILPSPLTLEEDIAVLAEGSAANGHAVRYRYRWFVNGQAVGNHSGDKLPASSLRRGDRVAVELTPYTEYQQGNPFRSAEAVVVNSPPVVRSVALSVQHKDGKSHLEASAESVDVDHDEVQLTYRWWKNKQLISEGENSAIDAKDLSPQDIVSVSVVPQDRDSKGREIFSDGAMLGNRPPTITSTPSAAIQNGQYEYTVTAIDPENEPLAYALETAPNGMVIGEKTGKITWAVPAEMDGSHKVRVVTRDVQGATAFQEFSLTIPPPPSARPEGA